MSLSMYQASVPVLTRMLNNLVHILDKAVAHAEMKNIDQSIFINARLAPDMFPLLRQVQMISDTAKGCAARLAGIDNPSFADTETTFAELKERIAKTITFVNSVTAMQIDGSEERKIEIKLPQKTLKFIGQVYLLNFVLPNFYFHLTTVYAILRHNGIDIGKMDYLGGIPEQK